LYLILHLGAKPMTSKKLHLSIAIFSAIFAISGLGVNIKTASIEMMPAVAQSCIRNENFSLVVASTNGITLRSERRLNARTSETVAFNQTVEFDAWAYGEEITDLWGNRDALWFKLKGRNLWVPSGYMKGFPPSRPSPRGSCTEPPPPPPPLGQVDMGGLQRLLFGNTPVMLTGGWGQVLQVWCRNRNFVGYVGCAHTGIDFAPTSGRAGAPIYSPIEGVVIRRSDDIGAVGIYNQKSNTTFFFVHMNTTSVGMNQTVARGQQIGTVGNKGYSTGVHLHLEARPGRQPSMALDVKTTINPLNAVNQAIR
jgi:murein DD-endopeptidase MepM/ murein hydrolase activator NlpD